MGDLTGLFSPDTGTTTLTYDSAGNLKTRTDARGQVTTFQYDALNRLTQMATADQTLNYQYDQGTNGKGHLTTVNDANHTLTFAYDAQGRVIQKQQTQDSITHATQYTYTNGDLTQETTPSGQVIAYSYTHGKVTAIQLNGATVLNQLQYDPFGPVTQWAWGNGTASSRSYDQDGYLTANTSAGTSSYTFNPDGSIATQTNDSSINLNLPTGLATFNVAAASNQLSSTTGTLTRANTFDAAGNLTSDGSRSFTFNGVGRMSSASNAGVTTNYVYNAQGQRIKKTNSSNTTLFAYDEQGHLLGEYTNTGALIQELVWLNDLPIATIRTDQSGGAVGFFYLHTDHLNTPRKITRPSDNAAIWRWDSDPYGNGSPNEDPDGNGLTLAFNLRKPGEYQDQETGLLYNYFRHRDPLTGFTTPDPIGLAGGSFSTYNFVNGNPISNIDPDGLTLRSNWNFFWDWTFGWGPKDRTYGPDTPETQEMSKGSGADVLRDLFYKGSCKNRSNVAYSSFHAFRDTIYLPGDTSFQVGGWAGATAVNNGNGTVTFTIPNTAGAHSFFYHKVPDRSSSTGPMSNIRQTFQWTEKIDQSRCGCQQ